MFTLVLGLLIFSACSNALVAPPQPPVSQQKKNFLDKLDTPTELNSATPALTQSVAHLCSAPAANIQIEKSNDGDLVVIPSGEWRVVYAPHMDFMGKLLHGRFAPVIYHIHKDNNKSNLITSHARVELCWWGVKILQVWLSVSGSFTIDTNTAPGQVLCRIVFDEAWVRDCGESDGDGKSLDNGYYISIEDVPDNFWKEWIRRLGKLLFVEPLAVFPISFLDDTLCVFDFEFLGTRICAYRMANAADGYGEATS